MVRVYGMQKRKLGSVRGKSLRHLIFGSGDAGLGRAMGRAKAVLSRIVSNERGNVVIVFAVGLTFIVGVVGLGVDAASWYSSKRSMQNAADLAAARGINYL